MATNGATRVEFDGESFSVDAGLIAESFGITSGLLKILMRQGRITSRCERGTDEDAGRHRLMFFHKARRLSLVVDETGNVIDRRMERSSPKERQNGGSLVPK